MPYTSGPMTEAMFYVLLSLSHPNHGYQLMNAIAQVSKGRIQMGPGTLYGVLTRLQKDGLITIVEDDGRRKIYEMNDVGRAALREEYNRLLSMVQDGISLRGEMDNENGK
ncbi:MAG: PadR family transcriptional regulator [Bacillota bacterium]|jgi:DNA-binding PadR family transcriptional regulator|nr:PadR family transcriptional regulator [Bacillota bacterium]